MTTIYYERDADVGALDGQRVAVVGYGNQGRSWALNLRDSGVTVDVCVRADESRAQAETDGFATTDVPEASAADVICLLIPDDVIPTLPITPGPTSLVIVASGYPLAFGRLEPPGDAGLVAPRMLGPEVRRCYEEGTGFITLVGVDRDATGTAQRRTLAVARAIGGLRQGGVEVTPMQEALVDLATEQVLAPALRHVHTTLIRQLLQRGVPLEAILAELTLSGENERTMRLVRLEGYAAQMAYHSPTSQYGQLSRGHRFDHVDVDSTMRQILDDIVSGAFADEWDAERDAGYPVLEKLRAAEAGPDVVALERDIRSRLGETAGAPPPAH